MKRTFRRCVASRCNDLRSAAGWSNVVGRRYRQRLLYVVWPGTAKTIRALELVFQWIALIWEWVDLLEHGTASLPSKF